MRPSLEGSKSLPPQDRGEALGPQEEVRVEWHHSVATHLQLPDRAARLLEAKDVLPACGQPEGQERAGLSHGHRHFPWGLAHPDCVVLCTLE